MLEREVSRDRDEDRRDDTRILDSISSLDHKMQEGMAYLGGGLANVAQMLNDHESRLHMLEKVTGTTSRRMQKVVPPPRPPNWMPVSSRLPTPGLPFDPEKK
jgi:hypothetical protein